MMDNSAQNDAKADKKFEDEMAHLRAIFPDEIWEIILNKLSTVTSATTLQHISNASPYFRHILLDQRVEFLFHFVFPIIAYKSEPPLDPVQASKVRNYNKIYKCDMSYLNLRLVSMTWRNAIDNYLQNHRSHFISFCAKNLWYSIICSATQVQASSPTNDYICSKFLEHFESSHNSTQNPFISRSVRLNSIGNYITELKTMLTKYGHHIWYCDISMGNSSTRLANSYIHLIDLVKLMPNLKVLNIVFVQSSLACMENSVEVPACEVIAQLQQEIDRKTFPKLEHLVLLKTFNLPAPIFNKVLKHNNHVKMIEASNYKHWINMQDYGYNDFSVGLPNLTHLAIIFCCRKEILKLDESKIDGQLKKLHVDSLRQTCGYVRFSKVLKVIETKWSDSLTDLSLNLSQPPTDDLLLESYNEYPNLKLNFPKLRKLKLGLWNMLPLDIILPTKGTLEWLHVIVNVKIVDGIARAKKLEELKINQQIQFLGSYWFKMGSSNIWELCGKLKVLVVEVDSTHVDASGKRKPRISHFKQLYSRKDRLKYLKSQQQNQNSI